MTKALLGYCLLRSPFDSWDDVSRYLQWYSETEYHTSWDDDRYAFALLLSDSRANLED